MSKALVALALAIGLTIAFFIFIFPSMNQSSSDILIENFDEISSKWKITEAIGDFKTRINPPGQLEQRCTTAPSQTKLVRFDDIVSDRSSIVVEFRVQCESIKVDGLALFYLAYFYDGKLCEFALVISNFDAPGVPQMPLLFKNVDTNFHVYMLDINNAAMKYDCFMDGVPFVTGHAIGVGDPLTGGLPEMGPASYDVTTHWDYLHITASTR